MQAVRSRRPLGVTVLSVVLFLFGVLAFFGSLFLWGEGFLLAFPPGVDYAFPVTDILVNAPASIVAAVGLNLHLVLCGATRSTDPVPPRPQCQGRPSRSFGCDGMIEFAR